MINIVELYLLPIRRLLCACVTPNLNDYFSVQMMMYARDVLSSGYCEYDDEEW